MGETTSATTIDCHWKSYSQLTHFPQYKGNCTEYIPAIVGNIICYYCKINVYNKTYTCYSSTVTVCTSKSVSTEPHWDQLFRSECPGVWLKKIKCLGFFPCAL